VQPITHAVFDVAFKVTVVPLGVVLGGAGMTQPWPGLDHLEPFGAPSIFAHGSFAMFAAIRLASSRVSSLAAARLPGSSSK
jgi:hypothetical protein